jgi:hypothetical protein
MAFCRPADAANPALPKSQGLRLPGWRGQTSDLMPCLVKKTLTITYAIELKQLLGF